MYNYLLLSFLLLGLVFSSYGAKILLVCPSPAVSHQKPFQTLSKALLQRGHEVTFFTTNPLKIDHENLTEIDLSEAYAVKREVDFVTWADMTPLESVSTIIDVVTAGEKMQLENPVVKEFARQNHTFDAVIFEKLHYQAYYGLFHKLGSPPLIGFVTLQPDATNYYTMGSPMNPAYMPDIWIGYSDHMNFWQRLHNTYFYLRFFYYWYYEVLPNQESIMREHFGMEPPSVYETESNFSLLITNTHYCLEYPRPQTPNIVEITGIHVPSEVDPLPKDIKKFLDEAEHGVIYFSLGSNVKSKNLPPEVVDAYLWVFRQLPQRVIWKWEDDNMPSLPENVMTRKWLPQTAVLAHPKVRLFIMQGGLQSMNEAAYHGIPFVVTPFFSDQHHNAAKIQQAEIGIRIRLKEITKDTLLHAVRTVLEDPKYSNNMKRLSAVFRDHRADSLDRAVWWIEYVIRHKGAPHLRSAALDLHWWQLLLLDVIAFVLAVAGLALYVVYFVTRRIVSSFTGSKQNQKQKKH